MFNIQTITVYPALQKSHVHLTMQNEFSPTLKFPIVLTVPMVFKSPNSKSLLRSSQTLNYESW